MKTRTDWPKRARQTLKFSSRVDLEGEHIDDLGRLGQPAIMRTLNLSYCQIATIEGLKPLLNLETFIGDGSQLTSLKNFSAIENIRKLSLVQTPVSRDPQFVLSVLLVCPNLTSINGRQVPGAVRQRAIRYAPLGRKLVDAGWMAEWPVPTEERITELCVEFNVQIETDGAPEGSEHESDAIDNFEEVVAGYFRQHRNLVQAMKKSLGFKVDEEEEDDVEEEEEDIGEEESQLSSNGTETKMDDFEVGEDQDPMLVERLADVLKANEVEIDDNDLCNSVLAAIESLCEEKEEKRKAELNDESDSSQTQEQ